jgi:hypothetical protein
MKKFMLIVVALLVSTTAFGNDDPILFELSGCDVIVTTNTIPVDTWNLCITNRTYVGLHKQSELIGCDQMVPVVYNEIIDLTQYINDCDADDPMPNGFDTWGTIKATYR